MDILQHYPLAPLTTCKVGGSARYFAAADSIVDIERILSFADQQGVPTVVLGGGSNTLIDDGEAEGLFIHPRFQGIEHKDTQLIVFASESWDGVVAYAVQHGLYGLENLSGIPGSVGGAVVQNIGAYGAALSETLAWAEAFDLQERRVIRFDADACAFGYRDSLFKQHPGRYVLLRAALTLLNTQSVNLSYRDLADHFANMQPTLAAVRDAVLAIRAQKFPDLVHEGTAGSFFKNPVVGLGEGERLQEKYPALPLFLLPETEGYKVPLAWILDRVLSMRGFTIGNVRCFEKQPLVLVANRQATAREVRILAHEVQKRVFEETAIVIEPEVCVMHGSVIAHTLDF